MGFRTFAGLSALVNFNSCPWWMHSTDMLEFKTPCGNALWKKLRTLKLFIAPPMPPLNLPVHCLNWEQLIFCCWKQKSICNIFYLIIIEGIIECSKSFKIACVYLWNNKMFCKSIFNFLLCEHFRGTLVAMPDV